MGRTYKWIATVRTVDRGVVPASGTASGPDNYTPEAAERDVHTFIRQPEQAGCLADAEVTVTEND